VKGQVPPADACVASAQKADTLCRRPGPQRCSTASRCKRRDRVTVFFGRPVRESGSEIEAGSGWFSWPETRPTRACQNNALGNTCVCTGPLVLAASEHRAGVSLEPAAKRPVPRPRAIMAGHRPGLRAKSAPPRVLVAQRRGPTRAEACFSEPIFIKRFFLPSFPGRHLAAAMMERLPAALAAAFPTTGGELVCLALSRTRQAKLPSVFEVLSSCNAFGPQLPSVQRPESELCASRGAAKGATTGQRSSPNSSQQT